jgi:superfamily II DNA helicase RecQ
MPWDDEFVRFAPTIQRRFNRFPYDWQGHAISATMKKRDLMVRAGTGSGKSLIYQAAALFHPHAIVLVVSPLLGLMEDQVTISCTDLTATLIR